MKEASIEVMKNTKSVRDIDVKDKRVLIRVDFNVPMGEDFDISDDTRIREALPTINYCTDNHAQSIVLVSHLGRPKGRSAEFSLKHVIKRVERLLGRDVDFAENIENVESLQQGANGNVILLENIRFYEGEEKIAMSFHANSPPSVMYMSMMPLAQATAPILALVALQNMQKSA